MGIARPVKDRLVADGQGGPTSGKVANLKGETAVEAKNGCC